MSRYMMKKRMSHVSSTACGMYDYDVQKYMKRREWKI